MKMFILLSDVMTVKKQSAESSGFNLMEMFQRVTPSVNIMTSYIRTKMLKE